MLILLSGAKLSRFGFLSSLRCGWQRKCLTATFLAMAKKLKKHRYQSSRKYWHLKSSCNNKWSVLIANLVSSNYVMTHFLISSLGADSRVTAVFQSLPEFKGFSSRHLCPSHVLLNPHLKEQVTQTSSLLETHWLSTPLIHVLPHYCYTEWNMSAACPGTLCTQGASWTSWTVPHWANTNNLTLHTSIHTCRHFKQDTWRGKWRLQWGE